MADNESSFNKGVGITLGVLFALLLVFVVLPCAVCGGLTMVGSAVDGPPPATQQSE